MGLAAIRQGIKENLAEGLPRGVQVSEHALANPNLPAAQVVPQEVFLEFDKTFARGSDTYYLYVEVFVAMGDAEATQRELDKLVDAAKGAIEARREIDGACDDLHVTEASAYGLVTFPGRGQALGCRLAVEVIT